jgi:hypothetical protein
MEISLPKERFSKRHYVRIAEVIRELGRDDLDLPRPMFNRIKKSFGDMLAADNPRFNKGKFEEACEP